MLVGLQKKAWQQWFLGWAFWTLIGLAFAGQLYLSRSKIGDPVTWTFALGRALADWYGFALLSIPTLWLARYFPLDRRLWRRTVFIHLAGSALFSLAWMVLRAGAEQWQSRENDLPVTFEAAFTHALAATFFFNLLIYWAIVSVSHAAAFYVKYQERERRAAELENRLTQARLQALQMQLNPHFLFNTLHAISSLMHKNVAAADRMLIRLSDLLRYTLENTEVHEVPLRQELDFLGRYLEIQQIRFGDRLRVERDIDPATLEARVPNLLLQPLVENAVRHGIEPKAKSGLIGLSARRQDQVLELQVRDNGVGLASERPAREGVGLANTRARLRHLYGADFLMELRNAPEGGVVATVRIPWRAF